MKKKVLIHGAHKVGQSLAMKLDHVFDIVAFCDRNTQNMISEFNGIPCYSDMKKVRALDLDYILVSSVDFEGIQIDYKRFCGIAENKVINLHHGHQEGKRRLFYCMANEIYRQGISGVVAEVGVDFGDTARYINFFFPDRRLYLFDTFEGFAADDVAHEKSLGTMAEAVIHSYDQRSTENDVLRRMYYPEMCVVKKGRVPDSLFGLEDEHFAFVHIDCDLSKPVADSLEYFFPRLVRHGYACIHDFFNPNFPGVRAVVRKFADKNGLTLVPNPAYGGAILCKN